MVVLIRFSTQAPKIEPYGNARLLPSSKKRTPHQISASESNMSVLPFRSSLNIEPLALKGRRQISKAIYGWSGVHESSERCDVHLLRQCPTHSLEHGYLPRLV